MKFNRKCINGHMWDYGVFGDACPFCPTFTVLDYIIEYGKLTGKLNLIDYTVPCLEFFTEESRQTESYKRYRDGWVTCPKKHTYYPAFCQEENELWYKQNIVQEEKCPECENQRRIKTFLENIHGGIELFEKYYK